MEKPILIPELGDDIESVKLIGWLVKKGDTVKKGEPVAVMETEKVAFEVEAPEDGVIDRLQFSEGDKVNMSKPIAYIIEPRENPADAEISQKNDVKTIDEKQPPEKGFRRIFKRKSHREK